LVLMSRTGFVDKGTVGFLVFITITIIWSIIIKKI